LKGFPDKEVHKSIVKLTSILKTKNKQGQTALDPARSYNHSTMASLLAEKTASR